MSEVEQAPGPARPSIWPVLLAYAAAFALMLGGSVVLVGAVALVRSEGRIERVQDEVMRYVFSSTGLMALAAVSAGALLLVAFATARLSSRDVPGQLRLGPTRATATGYLAAIVGTSALSLVCGSAADLLGARGGSVMDKLADAMRNLTPPQLALAIGTIGVAPGLAEETFFRGLMQTRLAARWGRWPAIVASAFAFGLMHLDKVQSPLAFVLGIFLGWVAERLHGIRPTVAAHAVNNAIFVAAACFGQSQDASRGTELALIAGGAVVWGLCTAVLRTRSAVRE